MDRQICSGCKIAAPDMGNGFTTLASPSSGWCLARVRGPDGANSVVWRCPECWRAHRKASARRVRAASQM